MGLTALSDIKKHKAQVGGCSAVLSAGTGRGNVYFLQTWSVEVERGQQLCPASRVTVEDQDACYMKHAEARKG